MKTTSFSKKKFELVNFLYFSFFTILLFSLSLPSWIEWSCSPLPKALNFIVILTEAFLEGSLLLLLGYLLKHKAPKALYAFYIVITFLLLLGHVLNFLMLRLLDTSILYIFKNLFSGGLENFFLTMRAVNFNLTLIIGLILLIPLLPMTGLGFFKLMHWIEKKLPFSLPGWPIFYLQLISLLLLISIQFFVVKTSEAKTFLTFEKNLPWPIAFFSIPNQNVKLSFPLKKPRTEASILQALEECKLNLKASPNIYIFVLEALRSDCITEEIAPNLTNFKSDCFSFSQTFSNANASHISWFSIFHSNIPLHWQHYRDNHSLGSIPLFLLKKSGYEIFVFSSAELAYHHMDESLFGKEQNLTNLYKCFNGSHAWERDSLTMQSLLDHVKKEKKQLYITFLDSTHSEYSFPPDQKNKFEPISPFINYLSLSLTSKDLPLVKNRYYNAVYFLDSLIGQFIKSLKEQNLYEDAIIVILGDHGEEFYEEKALFHGTHLNTYQTCIPILCKFGKNIQIPQQQIISQMDIFPSILDYISEKNNFENLFDGQSFFKKNPMHWTMIAKQNAGLTPKEIALTNGKEKLIVELQGSQDVLEASHLSVILHEKDGKSFNEKPKNVKKTLQNEIAWLFE